MKHLKKILAIAIFLLVALYAFWFMTSNTVAPSLSVLPSIQFELNIGVLLVCSFLIGLSLGALLVYFSLIGQKMKTGKAQRELKKAQKEVEGLRAAAPEAA